MNVKLTRLAALLTVLVSAQSAGIEVYKNADDSLNIGGRLGVVTQFNDGNAELIGDSSRINFVFAHQLSPDWTGEAVAEWGFGELNSYSDSGKSDLFWNRLGYVALEHKYFGRISLGKQWSAYYGVAGWTDKFIVGGANSLGVYDDGDISGTARADDSLLYKFSVNGFTGALQYQFEKSNSDTPDGSANRGLWHRENGQQVALSYGFDNGISVGYSYSATNYEKALDTKLHVAALKYENGDMYLAIAYGQFENATKKAAADSDNYDRESEGLEVFAKYDIDQVLPGLYLMLGYNYLDVIKDASNNSSAAGLTDYMLGAGYEIGPMLFGTQVSRNETKTTAGSDNLDNKVELNARYYF